MKNSRIVSKMIKSKVWAGVEVIVVDDKRR